MAGEISAREEILRRVRTANGGASTFEAAQHKWNEVARKYKRRGTLENEAMLALLQARLRDYDATVSRCGRREVAQEIARMLSARGKRRLVVPVGLPAERLPAGFDFVVDEGLAAAVLDGSDGVLTESTLAIAETGTLVLQTVTGQGRRMATLVPDYHLCLVRVEDVVETLPEAFERLQATAGLATTLVSGPSATADIEMTRIKGVHGPRFLDVILIS